MSALVLYKEQEGLGLKSTHGPLHRVLHGHGHPHFSNFGYAHLCLRTKERDKLTSCPWCVGLPVRASLEEADPVTLAQPWKAAFCVLAASVPTF